MAKRKLELVVSNEPAEAEPAELPPQQQEMPFAMVNGEPVTELPKDLYIPPQALEVFLEAFEGPLDLLLYLIRRQNLDVLDIPIAEITRQYMKYIEVMTEMQLELAGEYMVMAATLAEIKSRMLLPRQHVQGDGTEEDPRAELVRRLQEYERFKQAAENIDGLERLERDTWTASAELKDRKVVRLLPEITLKEMLLAFKDVVVRSEMFAHHHIQRERLSIRQRMSDIVSTLEHSSFVEFARLFRAEEGRMGVTVTFVAILELVREGLIEIVQTEPFAPLHVRPAGAHRGLRLVSNNERGEEQVATAIAPADEGPSADELLLKSTEPFDDDDDDFDEEDLPLEGVDDVVAVPIGRAAEVDAIAASEEVASVEVTAGPAADELGVVETVVASSYVVGGFSEAEETEDRGVAEATRVEDSAGVSEALEEEDEEIAEVVDAIEAENAGDAIILEAAELEVDEFVEAEEAANAIEAADIADASEESEIDATDEASVGAEAAVTAPVAVAEAEAVEDADVVEEADASHADIRTDAAAIDEAVAAEEAVAADVVTGHETHVTLEPVDPQAIAADETHEAADELSASDEPNESDESGDADEPNEISDKPPAGGTPG